MTEPASNVASCSGTSMEKSSSPPSEIAIGIDIGTSPCCVSVWNGSHVLVWDINEMMERLCINSNDHGFSTEAALPDENVDTMSNMKSFFSMIFGEGTNFPFLMHTVDIKVRPFVAPFVKKLWKSTTAVEILGKFMMELKSLVETRLKGPISNVVFTVPVSFSQLQINRIHRACAMADLKVTKLMPQPTAVALWYVYHQVQPLASSHQDMDNESEKVALIFNMDAGYCDVAVIATEKRKIRIKALTGSTIGGEDLLGNMMFYHFHDSENIFTRDVRSETDIISMASLRCGMQDLITDLSSEESVRVDLNSVDGMEIHRYVTRKEFEDVNKEVFEKCESLIIKCMKDAKIKAENINDVIIVGGCCNIPKVQNLVKEICKVSELYTGIDPLHAVLSGAAFAGAPKHPSDSLDLFTSQFTLFTVRVQSGSHGFVPIIPRNTSVPTWRDIVFRTIQDNQTQALILVYEGDDILGHIVAHGIPEAPRGVPKVKISIAIDHTNRFTVNGSVEMPGSEPSAISVHGIWMAETNDGHVGWCDELLIRTYGHTFGYPLQ
ncbi:heat shock 70 kDa protein 8-like [Trifolium pratense]|nr:heat shock 70 kDa protein 8-like [Trifolium pratense]